MHDPRSPMTLHSSPLCSSAAGHAPAALPGQHNAGCATRRAPRADYRAPQHRPVTIAAATGLNASADTVFAFHSDARNLSSLTPGGIRVLTAAVPTRAGDLQQFEVGWGPLRRRWHARIERFEPPTLIVDVQERGPFRVWRHVHAVLPEGRSSLLIDVVSFRLLSGRLGQILDAVVIAPMLHLLLAERHRRTRRQLNAILAHR